MNKIIRILSFFILSGSLLTSCTKDDSGNTADVRPAVPVTVQNAIDYRPDPTVGALRSTGGVIQIILTIPAGLGRTIKEISKVAANTTYTQIQGTGTTGFYNSAPIAGTGTTATFTTSLTEYFLKKPITASNLAANVNAELGNRFYFLVTLDDNSVIVTRPVRVLVLD
ncbi:MAG: hypothetical protein ABIN89_24135 [Chitinophagaceae bacterium]